MTLVWVPLSMSFGGQGQGVVRISSGEGVCGGVFGRCILRRRLASWRRIGAVSGKMERQL